MKKDGLVTFPFKPTTIEESKFYVIENDDIRTCQDLRKLINIMYRYPERQFYLIAPEENSVNTLIRSAMEQELILFKKTESSFFLHPNFKRDYVQIYANLVQFSWEKELFNSGTRYMRITLILSENTKRETHIRRTIQIQEEIRMTNNSRQDILNGSLHQLTIVTEPFSLLDEETKILRNIAHDQLLSVRSTPLSYSL